MTFSDWVINEIAFPNFLKKKFRVHKDYLELYWILTEAGKKQIGGRPELLRKLHHQCVQEGEEVKKKFGGISIRVDTTESMVSSNRVEVKISFEQMNPQISDQLQLAGWDVKIS